jgi:hypothetical protein
VHTGRRGGGQLECDGLAVGHPHHVRTLDVQRASNR